MMAYFILNKLQNNRDSFDYVLYISFELCPGSWHKEHKSTGHIKNDKPFHRSCSILPVSIGKHNQLSRSTMQHGLWNLQVVKA